MRAYPPATADQDHRATTAHAATLGLLAHRIERAHDVVSLTALLDGIGRLFSDEAGRRGIALHCRVASDLSVAIRLDSLRLRHILANFVCGALADAATGAIEVAASAVDGLDGTPGMQFVVSTHADANAGRPASDAPRSGPLRADAAWIACERLAAQMDGWIRRDVDDAGRIVRTLLLMLPRTTAVQPVPARGSRRDTAPLRRASFDPGR